MSKLNSELTFSISHFHFSLSHLFTNYLLASEATRVSILKNCVNFLQVRGYLSRPTPRVNRPWRQVDDLLSSNVEDKNG